MSDDTPTLSLILDEEQRMLADTAAQFIRESAPVERLRTLRDEKDETGYSLGLWKEVAELGWLGLQIPEQYDGMELGFFDLCVILEATGRNLMPEPFLSTLAMGAQALTLGGTDEQKQAWLPDIGLGEATITLADREPGRAYEPFRVETTAKAVDGAWLLEGRKIHVLDGMASKAIIVPARTSGEPGDEAGITLFLVDADALGMKRTRLNRIDHRNVANLALEGVRVEAKDVLGELDAGYDLLAQVIDRATIALSATMLGAAEQAFEDTVAYIKERVQFDVPIGSFQALQHRAARLFCEIALTRSSVLAAARAVDVDPSQVPRLASLAKAKCSDMFTHVAAEAIQMHGGVGMTDEYDVGFYFKWAQVAKVTFGDADYHRARWAELNGY